MQQSDIKEALDMSKEQSFKRRKLDEQEGTSLDPGSLEILFIKFIIACSLPFRIVECAEFQTFLRFLNKEVFNWLPTSHTPAD